MTTRSVAAIPRRMQDLPLDKRHGFPIPWNVLRGLDGGGLFTVNDDRKHYLALGRGLCPMCGERLGQFKWFIGGPRAAFHPNGWYLDLPAHRDCGEYALQTCPYLAAPKYLGRVDIPNPANVPPEAKLMIDHTMIPERPEVFVMSSSTGIEVQDNGRVALPYVRPRKPVLGYQFWRHGKRLSDDEAHCFIRAVMGKDWVLP